MEETRDRELVSPPAQTDEATTVLKAQVVEAIVARVQRGEPVKRLAAEFGVDPKTIRAWRDRGAYQARAPRTRASILAPHRDWLRARAPEVEYNSAVLYRELKERGYTGCSQQVLRFVRPLRVAARQRATIRFETEPGRQAQVDFGQRQVWIADRPVIAHVFVFTLGYSRRCYVEAFRHERLEAVLAGHEHAFHHFAGVPQQIVVDNARPVVLSHKREPHDDGRDRHSVVWHPAYADFATYYGFEPWAHWPYHPQTKGKTESGVKYVQRNALVGKRFGAWEQVNEWLLEWATTIADCRVHGTTHEIPQERFRRAEERQLTALGNRPLYARERVTHRVVATDALVAIGGSRYSVPVAFVGCTVTVRELLGAYEILHAGQVIARHAREGRHRVVMERAHYADLLRPGGSPRSGGPPRHDPRYPASADVAVRDLTIYAAIADAADGSEP